MSGRTLLLLVTTMALVLALVVGCGGGGGQPQQKEEAAEQRERNPQPQQQQEGGEQPQEEEQEAAEQRERNPQSQEEEAGAGQRVVKTIRIEETEFKLQPAQIMLDKPGTYVFKAVNSGDTVHALEVEGEGIEEETEEIEPGQSAELKVKLNSGTYELYCPVDGHAEEGMEGMLTVKEGSGGSGGY